MKAFILGLFVIFWSSVAMGANLYTFNGGGTSGNWTDPTIWTTDPTGSTSINAAVPGNGDNVTVTNSFVVYVPSAIATTGLSITIQRGGVLDLTTASSTFAALNSLSGQGTLRIAAPYFPTVTTNNFDDANTGTVEFYNWPAGPTALPNPASGMYNNLRLLNTTATAYVAQLDNDLTLSGTLTLTRTNVTGPVTLNLGRTASINRTLNALGDITIGTGTFLGVTAVAGSHILNASGNFVNNGTVNLHNGTLDDAQVAILVFKGATPTNFACNGSTDLDILRLDKGIDSQVQLNITSTVNVGGNAQGNLRLNHVGDARLLELINGVAKVGNNVYLSKIHNGSIAGGGVGTGYYELGSSATSPTLWVAGGTVINNNALAFVIYGTLRVSSGSITSVTSDAMVVREDGQVLIEGGTTTVNKFRPSSTSSAHRGSFIISGGLFDVPGSFAGAEAVTSFARFAIPYQSQAFRMTGGTIRVANPANCTGLFHIGVNSSNAIVSNGTIELQLPNTNTNASILTTAPLWNLLIKKPTLSGGTTSKAILADITSLYTAGATNNAQPLTVLNSFTLDPTNPTTFDAANFDITLQGTLNIGTGCSYLPGTNTTIFSGAQDQQLVNNGTIGVTAGNGTFNNWTVNKTNGTLTLAGSVTNYFVPVNKTLSLLQGVLSDGGKTIFVQGNIVNSATHTSGGGLGSITMNGASAQTINGDGTGVFGNLKINSTMAVGSIAVTMAANMAVSSVLTLQSTHVLYIASNRLSLTNVNTNAMQPLGGFNNQRMVQTAGLQSDLGLQKTYGGPQSFTFPVGTGTKFTPATVDLQLATGLAQYGQVSVSPVSSRSPFVTSAANSLAYYWKVRSKGFGTIPSGAIYSTFQMINADAAGYVTSPNNYVAGRYLPVSWNTSFSGGVSSFGTYSDIAFNALDQFDGEFTAGQPATFGPVTAYYTRVAAGNWETPATWSTVGYGGAAAGVKPGAGNPVFIGTGSTVTVTANTALSGSLEIATGGTLDVQTFTGHNFGALPDSKPGGSGTLRITATVVKSGSVYNANPVFPSGDFGSFLQAGGGTVEYYGIASANAYAMAIPSSSASGLNLNSYSSLILNPVSNATANLPGLDLRIYAQLKAGTSATFSGNTNLSGAVAGNLRIGSLLAVQAGSLHFSNGSARSLTLDGDLQISSGATFDVLTTGTAVTNSLTLGGSCTNNGVLNFKVGTRTADLTFIGSTNTSLTTAASTTTSLNTLTVNKGTNRTATLNVDGNGSLTTPLNSWLTLTNGTLRYAKPSTTLTIHDGVATPYTITDNAGLTVDASGATVTVATFNDVAADLKLAGLVQVLQGTLRVGTAGNGGNDLEYASAGAPGLKVLGGALYVNGQIRRSVNNLDGSLRFDQTAGTIDIDGQGAAAALNNERGLFEVQGPKSIFRMSAGTMTLHRSNGRPTIAADLYLAPDSTVVTGGTIVLGNPAAAPIGSNVTVSVDSSVPLYDMLVATGANGTNTNTGLHTGVLPLTLKGSLTIGNDNSFFNANGLDLNIYQNLTNGNSSTSTALNVGGFQPITTTQTTYFLGGIPTQTITGASNLTVFGSLVMNTPVSNGKLQLVGQARTAGTLTLTKGTFDDNGYFMTVLGDVLNSATQVSTGGAGSIMLAGTANQNIGGNGTGRFGNLGLNNAAGATTTANQEITQILSLFNGVLTIGSNLLWLSNPATNALNGGFDATHFIRTNGVVADQGLRKTYSAGASSFKFAIGTATKYTPVQMNLTSNGAVGTITVQAVDRPHPSTTDPANKELAYYWKVRSTGLSAPQVDKSLTYQASDVRGTEANYKIGLFLNGAWTPANGIGSSYVDATNHVLTSLNRSDVDGDYTGGEPSEFGTVPAFYSRNATAGLVAGATWTNAAAWTYNADGSDSSPLPITYPTLANPVVILPNHLIYSTSAGLGAATLLLNGTLNLAAFAANNFNTVTGTGTLRIGSALFPAGNYTNFVAPNTGTVDFTAAVQLPARDTYNNLTLSGGTNKQFTNQDLTINGLLNVALNTLVDNPTSQAITLTSATSGVLVNGTLNLNDGNLTTKAGVTAGGTGSLNLGAGTVSVGTTLATLNGGTINQSSGKVTTVTLDNAGTYNASTGNLAVGTNFVNSGSYNAGAGNLDVAGTTTNTASGVITAANGEINTVGVFSNAGTYQATTNNIMHVTGDFFNLSGAAFDAANSNIILRGSFTNRGVFASGSSLVQFITDVNRSIDGTTTFYELQKLGTSTLTMGTGTDVHVNYLLTIQNSVIYTGANTGNTLYLDNGTIQPIIGNNLSSFIVGRLAMKMPDAGGNARVFPVGANQRYRPVTIRNTGGSSNAIILVEIIKGAPAGTVDATLDNLSATRYYRIQMLQGTITAPTVQLSFNTNPSEPYDEKVTVPGNLRIGKTTTAGALPTVANTWSTAGGSGVFSPDAPSGYAVSAPSQTTITANSFFSLASTNRVDNPLDSGTPPLPVELISFTAVRQGSAVRTAWATASEKNSAYFVVQRSKDSRTFSDLTKVEAQGNSTNRHDYSAVDNSPLSGVSYYRLRQVDNDGKVSFSPVAIVRFEGQNAAPALLAYPNPATPAGFQLTAVNLSAPGGTVQVFDNVGRIVLTQTLAPTAAEATIQPARPLTSGMYFVTWKTIDGTKLNTKVVVE